MKRIDFTVAGIISAVWAILTCIFCGFGNTINHINQVEIGGGWYLPLPNRYWDWLFIGVFYIMMATCLRGHWLPNRKLAESYKNDDDLDFVCFMVTFGITLIIATKILVIIRHNVGSSVDMSLILILSCIGARRGRPVLFLMGAICLSNLIHALFFGWYFASLATLIILVAKILIWLVVNIVRSGFSTAWRQMWTSVVLGKNPFDEGDSGNTPAPNTVVLAGHADCRQGAQVQ